MSKAGGKRAPFTLPTGNPLVYRSEIPLRILVLGRFVKKNFSIESIDECSQADCDGIFAILFT
jgi:hypothetical protein